MLGIDLLKAYGLKPKPGAWFFTLSDEPGWITVHPHGEGTKGQPVLLEKRTGEILGGLGGKFNGKHISALPQQGRNEEHGAQALITWYNKTQKGKTATGGTTAKTPPSHTAGSNGQKTSEGGKSLRVGNIQSKLGTDYAGAQAAIKNGDALAKKIYSKFEKHLTVHETKAVDDKGHPTAFYRPSTKGVYFHATVDRKGTTERAKFSILYHELGHHIDYLNGKDQENSFAYAYKNGVFVQTIKQEVDSYVDKRLKEMKNDYNNLTKEEYIKKHYKSFKSYAPLDYILQNIATYERAWGLKPNRLSAYRSISAEITQNKTTSKPAISDIFSGATINKIRDGYLHDSGYWKIGEHKLATEAFANMFSTALTSPEKLTEIKKYFPKSVKIFEDMLKALS